MHVGLSLGAGVLHVLHATRPVWRNLAEHLRREFEIPDPVHPRPEPKVDGRKTRSRRLKPETRALYVAAYADFRNGAVATKSAAARRHGLPYNAWQSWCTKHLREIDPEVAGRNPYLKPGGAIL